MDAYTSPTVNSASTQLVGRESDLSSVKFRGGLNQTDVVSLVSGLPTDKSKELKQKLNPHVGIPESNQPPKDAVIGSFTKAEAERWLDEQTDEPISISLEQDQ